MSYTDTLARLAGMETGEGGTAGTDTTRSVGSVGGVGGHSESERRDQRDRLCARLHRELTARSAPGLACWEPAWAPTAAALDAFMVVADEWADSGDEALVSRMQEGYAAVLAAWTDGARRWVAAGRPGPEAVA